MQQIFQKRVLKQYINNQDDDLLQARYLQFKKYQDKQFSIKKYKEEKYQDGFLTDVFENCLGYTKDTTNPDEFNLEREKKNIQDSKKADAAIYVDDKVIGVIELKGQDTQNLDKPQGKNKPSVIDQAFGYFNSHHKCKYVVVSNFDELRFYIDNKIDYEVFSLFNLDYDGFKKLHTILSYESIKTNLPLEIKEKSVAFEVDISNKFYKDYASFRTELFDNIVKNNPNKDKLTLLNQAQKLVDRIVFILFAEDTNLLPVNTISEIIKQHEQQSLTDFSLYKVYRIYFKAIDSGNQKLKINQYNGGLFAKDTNLDDLKIDDEVLDKQAKTLSFYNFGSDISVNILGHIFEQSISDIEELTAQIQNQDYDKKQSKRKKDGVFYTPAYITKYIVDNTLGKICADKRAELEIQAVEKIPQGKKLTKLALKQKQNLEIYKNWLTSLKILDPACGSGAFLNQALEFLLTEHQKLASDFADVGDLFSQYNIDKTILENNLYGVDINEGAVEIAKLSLWLKTANNKRPLTKLADKIKCGNSLTSFDWQNEFSEVFTQGGFDIVIGNPPYVSIKGINIKYRRHYETIYKTATGRFDLYTLFIEKAMQLKKLDGSFSFIVPGKILNNKQFKVARKIICNNHDVKVLKIDDKVFSEASVDSAILLNQKINNNNISKYKAYNLNKTATTLLSETNTSNILNDPENIFRLRINEKLNQLLKKIQNNSLFLDQIADIKDGIVAGTIKDILFLDKKENSNCKEIYFGKNLSRYYLDKTDIWVNYQPEKMMAEELRRKEGKRHGLWMRDKKVFLREKIIYRKIGTYLTATITEKETYYEQTIHSCHITDNSFEHKFILCLFNSFLFKFYYQKTNSKGGDIFPQIRISSVKNLPIKKTSEENQKPFIEKADIMLKLNKNLQETKQNFISELELEKIPKKLQNFENLNFDEFIKEYTKAKKLKFANKLQLRDFKNDWKALFETDKQETLKIQSQINITDKEIDQMVYKLYKLNDDEIKIIETV